MDGANRLQRIHKKSEEINVLNGVKQGGNCSPFLFKLYIDDMISEIIDSNRGFKLRNTKMGALCFADDTALVARNVEDMQWLIGIIER